MYSNTTSLFDSRKCAYYIRVCEYVRVYVFVHVYACAGPYYSLGKVGKCLGPTKVWDL